jgi:hypothetical protein
MSAVTAAALVFGGTPGTGSGGVCRGEAPDGGKPDGGKPDGGKPDGGKPDGGKVVMAGLLADLRRPARASKVGRGAACGKRFSRGAARRTVRLLSPAKAMSAPGLFVILSAAKNLAVRPAPKARFFAALRMTGAR